MKIEIDDSIISKIIEKETFDYIRNSPEYKQKIFFLIEKKMEIYFQSGSFEDLINEQITKVILNQNLGGVLEKFNENDFNNKFEHIMSRSILKSKLFEQMLSDKMKSFIKIG